MSRVPKSRLTITIDRRILSQPRDPAGMDRGPTPRLPSGNGVGLGPERVGERLPATDTVAQEAQRCPHCPHVPLLLVGDVWLVTITPYCTRG
jgi:hypothetical protein